LSVEVVHWNPYLYREKTRLARFGPKVNNFGDLLGPVIVEKMIKNAGVDARGAKSPHRLLAVGSIMHLGGEGDVVWGTGMNGKKLTTALPFEQLDVRAVRGPLTQRVLREKGIAAPAVFGDPGLLVGQLWSRQELMAQEKHRPYSVVPNFHDFPLAPKNDETVNPTGKLWKVIAKIAASDLVVGSSLHGIVIAESLGIPARLVLSDTEPLFKYQDYYEGTGRTSFAPAHSVSEALQLGGERLPEWDPSPLLDAFPYDLWATSRSLK
jgi:pyruvyltransferase